MTLPSLTANGKMPSAMSPATHLKRPDIGRPWPTGPVKMLRRGFEVAKPVRSARLYATALGAYKFWINGHVVGDQVLAPGWTDFRSHVAYQAYDVTADVKAGRNAIGAYLAPGWYTTPLQWLQQPYNYGNTPPALKAQLRIEHTDGSVDWVATDETWKADISPILKAEIYDGETYDARREQPGWGTAAFSDAQWKPVELIQPLEPEIVAQDFQPIRVDRTLHAKSLTSPKPGVYVFDFGQNMAGVARLHVQGAAGTEVQLRFAEVLNPDGTIYTENLRTAKATDHYVLSGKGARGVPAALYLSRLPLRGSDGVEVQARDRSRNRDCLPHRCAFHRAAAHRQRDDQPAMEQHPVGAALQLRRRAHRLPAA